MSGCVASWPKCARSCPLPYLRFHCALDCHRRRCCKNALVANTFRCRSHYLLRQYSTFRCISGRRVSSRLMRSTSFFGRTLMRGLNTHRGGQHASVSHHLHHLPSRKLRGYCSLTIMYHRRLRFSLPQCSTSPVPSMSPCS